MADLFVYGTLMTPAVMRAVIGRLPPREAAVLPDHRRHGLRGRVYPVVVPEAGAQVDGVLYTGLTPQELARLDRYEDDFYLRRRVTVRDATGRARTAWCYVLRPRSRVRLARRPWSHARFERTALRDYLARLRRG